MANSYQTQRQRPNQHNFGKTHIIPSAYYFILAELSAKLFSAYVDFLFQTTSIFHCYYEMYVLWNF